MKIVIKKIIEENKNHKYKLTAEGFSEMEVLGILRYMEKQVWADIYNANHAAARPAPPSKGITIEEFIKAPIMMTGRLKNNLRDYQKECDATFISEIDKKSFLLIRNAGKISWDEFEKLRDELKSKP